jgi:hypothetical protein
MKNTIATSAIYQDYSKTFRTPVENYTIAVLRDNKVDFTECDPFIRDEVMRHLSATTPYKSDKTNLQTIESMPLSEENSKTLVDMSLMISGMLYGAEGIKPKEMTMDAIESIYVDYPYGSPRHSKEKSAGGLFGSSVVDAEGQVFLRNR